MTAIDGTDLRTLEDFADRLLRASRALILCGAPPIAIDRSCRIGPGQFIL